MNNQLILRILASKNCSLKIRCLQCHLFCFPYRNGQIKHTNWKADLTSMEREISVKIILFTTILSCEDLKWCIVFPVHKLPDRECVYCTKIVQYIHGY